MGFRRYIRKFVTNRIRYILARSEFPLVEETRVSGEKPPSLRGNTERRMTRRDGRDTRGGRSVHKRASNAFSAD